MSAKPIIAVAFYSTYGHIASLAEEVIKGVEASGAVVKPYVFEETLSEEILAKMHGGQSRHPKYPILKPDDLKEVDGLIIGAPTRYGRVPAQVSVFFDACGGLWATGALVGKFVTLFTSVAGQHSGHETTALTTMPFFVHHGMVYVPIGYANPIVGEIDVVQGGSPYGASTIAGSDGSKQPSGKDLEVARFQGKYFSDFVGTFVKGKHAKTTSTGAIAAKELPATTEKPEGYAVSDNKGSLAPPLPTNLGAIIPGATAATGAAAPAAAAVTTKDEASAPVTKEAAVTPAATKSETTSTPATAAAPATAATTTPATAAPTAASTSAPATGATTAPKKKKGFFSCCGADGIDK